MMGLRQLACDVWILTKGYWGSEERWSARVLLISIIGLNLGLVGVNVLQNQANGALFTALQQRNPPGFYRAFLTVILLILLYLAVAVLRVYLDQTLQLRWRRWLTEQYVTRWLADRAFYRMRGYGRLTDPSRSVFRRRAPNWRVTRHPLDGLDETLTCVGRKLDIVSIRRGRLVRFPCPRNPHLPLTPCLLTRYQSVLAYTV